MTAIIEAPTAPETIPGVYDIPAELYHADPIPGGSLSSTGARKLLPPSCPALFKYEQDHPQAPRKEFDLGTAAHQLVLGDGPQLVRIDADEWRSNAVKAEVAAVRAAGAIPLKPAEYEQVHAMAAALRAHPVASTLLAPGRGLPEQSLFWQDRPTGIWRRARLDWLPNPGTGRMIIPDYKTTRDASFDAIQKAVHAYGYHQQADWYLSGARSLGLADQDAVFLFIFQEKNPPYLVTVCQLDGAAMRIGRELNRTAIELYAHCSKTGRWPGYSDDIELVPLPAWVERQYN